MAKLNEREERIVELTDQLVNQRINALPVHSAGFNHGFLWGYITINRAQKNGKVRTIEVKHCFGCFCPSNWYDAEKFAQSVAGVSHTWVNMD